MVRIFSIFLVSIGLVYLSLTFSPAVLAREACDPGCVSGSVCQNSVCTCRADCPSSCNSDGSCIGAPITGNSIQELGSVITRVINFLFSIIGGIAIIMVVLGGIKYIMASGDPKATDSARQTIQWALIGLIVVLLAVVIVNIVGNVFGVTNLNLIKIGV